MKVSTERTPDSQMVLQIEVEPERLERSLDKAYRKLVQRTAVPGFRKGKAPRPMLERYLGRDVLLHEALDILVPEVYNQAIEEQEIDAVDLPSIEVLQHDPPLIKATVPLRPTVDLSDYLSLRLARETPTVTGEEIDASVEELRHRYAVHEPVDRPVQVGDIVRADVRASVDGEEVFADDDAELRLREGAEVLVPGFAAKLIGAKRGEPTQFTIAIPQDYQQAQPAGRQGSLAGKPCTFTVNLHEVKQERLPELNDDFAREVGEGFSSLEALRQRLEADIRERKQAAAEEEYRKRAVDSLVAAAKAIEFPPVMVEREVDRLLQDEARAAGSDVDRYLEQMRKSAEERRQELQPQAEERVRRSLALSKLAELEGISVEAEEVDGEIDRLVGDGNPQGEQVRSLFSSDAGREALERSLLTRKTLERLVAIVSQDGPAPAEGSEQTGQD